MPSTAREYFTVDLRGLRVALAARAGADGVTESDVLRSALVARLGADARVSMPAPSNIAAMLGRQSRAKLSVRLTHLAAHRLDQNSRAAGLSRGAYLTGLINGVAPVVTSSDRIALSSALNHSAAELAVLGRDIRHLIQLLNTGSLEAARRYRQRFDTVDVDVRKHLELSARVLAELVPHGTAPRPQAPGNLTPPGRQP